MGADINLLTFLNGSDQVRGLSQQLFWRDEFCAEFDSPYFHHNSMAWQS